MNLDDDVGEERSSSLSSWYCERLGSGELGL
jgi:hypothetical protein